MPAPPVRASGSGAPFHNHQPLDLASQDPASLDARPLDLESQDARPHVPPPHAPAFQGAASLDAAGDGLAVSPVGSREEKVVVGECFATMSY